MNHFRAFEVEALRLLAHAKLDNAVVDTVCRNAEFVSCNHSGAGYSLIVRHRLLPRARLVLSQPTVLGQAGDIAGIYFAFLQDDELILEYAGTGDVPGNIRDLPVQVVAQGTAT